MYSINFMYLRLRLTSVYKCVGSATSNSILDRAIDSEDAQHKDFLRLVRGFYISMKGYSFSLFFLFKILIGCRSMLKDITNSQQKPRYSFPLQ